MTSPEKDSDQDYELLSAYLALGFALVPIWGVKDGHCMCPKGAKCVKSPGKHPNHRLAPNGVKNASRDPAIIRQWLRSAPGGNWAIRTGEPLTEGGFAVVVDVDPRNGGFESLAAVTSQHGEIPADTLIADTGGNGNHYVLASDAPVESHAPAPGIEVLGAEKYFLVAPSKHISGGEYTWAIGKSPQDVKIAKAIPWVIGDGIVRDSRPERSTGDTARETVLGEAFALSGALGVALADGSFAVKCPWSDEHSDARGRGGDSSTVILPPAGGSRFGGFSCKHSHCSQRRWQDVMQTFAPEVATSARQKYPLRPMEVAKVVDAPVMEEETQSEIEQQIALCKKRLGYKSTKSGFAIKKDIINVITILTYDPRWTGVLKYDDFAQTIRFTRPMEWHPDDRPKVPFETWTEESTNCFDVWLRRTWDIDLPLEKLIQAVSVVARRDSVHPLRAHIESLRWDGVQRAETWLSRYLGAEDNAYTRVAGRKWLISAIARAYRPGCKADHVLILEGPQGRGKSTALSVLTGADYFTDTPIDIGSKDAYLSLRGKWIVELAELSSLSRSDADRTKAFFSSPVDTYRPPYGRIPADFPRQCVFAGSVNKDEYLHDETGNRRFWPIACGVIDLEALREDRDQIWAEVAELFQLWVGRGEPTSECLWWPSYQERYLFEKEQAKRVSGDFWADRIGAWVHGKVGQAYLSKQGHITASQLFIECLDMKTADVSHKELMRLGRCMSQDLRWERVRPRIDGERPYAYRPMGHRP